ncbi:unnamed protein product [Durusdinium trenchii]|uniref:4-nitrophenylphosphatase n=1 Tax=Durusdinium trenchii TaxID=1381693 RepID=A0ABP0LU83_9DINO
MARVKQLLVVLSCLALNSRFRELVDHNRSLAFSGHWTKRRELDSRLAHKLIESAEAFVFDLDGVIWIGGFLVEGVQETLEDLRGHGKSVIFATNNAMRTRSEVASRLKSLGLDWVMESDVFNSANAVARLLEARGISKDRSIYIVGEAGLRDEVQALGYRTQGGPDDAGKSLKDIPTALERIDPSRPFWSAWSWKTPMAWCGLRACGCGRCGRASAAISRCNCRQAKPGICKIDRALLGYSSAEDGDGW